MGFSETMIDALSFLSQLISSHMIPAVDSFNYVSRSCLTSCAIDLAAVIDLASSALDSTGVLDII